MSTEIPIKASFAKTPSLKRRVSRPYRLAKPIWALPAILFVGVFFVLPLIANIIRSVTQGDALTHGPFIYYQRLFTDPYYQKVLFSTLQVSVVSTAACALLAYPIAFFMTRYAQRWISLIMFCLVAPLLTSIIMRTFGWSVILARRGIFNLVAAKLGLVSHPADLANSPIAVYIGIVHVLLPFMVLSITSVLQGMDTRLEESARSLGASKLRTFLTVTLPLSVDGITTGCILVFVLTNGSFLTMLLLGGGKVTTLALLIYQQFSVTQDIGFAAAMGNVLLLMALICLALQTYFVRRKGVKK